MSGNSHKCAIILNEFCSTLEYMKETSSQVILTPNCHDSSTRKHKFHVTFPFMRRIKMCDKKKLKESHPLKKTQQLFERNQFVPYLKIPTAMRFRRLLKISLDDVKSCISLTSASETVLSAKLRTLQWRKAVPPNCTVTLETVLLSFASLTLCSSSRLLNQRAFQSDGIL